MRGYSTVKGHRPLVISTIYLFPVRCSREHIGQVLSNLAEAYRDSIQPFKERFANMPYMSPEQASCTFEYLRKLGIVTAEQDADGIIVALRVKNRRMQGPERFAGKDLMLWKNGVNNAKKNGNEKELNKMNTPRWRESIYYGWPV